MESRTVDNQPTDSRSRQARFHSAKLGAYVKAKN